MACDETDMDRLLLSSQRLGEGRNFPNLDDTNAYRIAALAVQNEPLKSIECSLAQGNWASDCPIRDLRTIEFGGQMAVQNEA